VGWSGGLITPFHAGADHGSAGGFFCAGYAGVGCVGGIGAICVVKKDCADEWGEEDRAVVAVSA